jgi:hypothetical protein
MLPASLKSPLLKKILLMKLFINKSLCPFKNKKKLERKKKCPPSSIASLLLSLKHPNWQFQANIFSRMA